MRDPNIARVVYLSPYRPGMGPRFRLTITDNHGWDECGRIRLGYKLEIKRATLIESGYETLFTDGGNAHVCVDGIGSDSDRAVASVLGWLTLRPGDTDADYFANHTPAQLEFCALWAETLSHESMARFGEDA